MDTNNIPPGGGEVNPKEKKRSRQWKYLSRIDNRFFGYLVWQWNEYRKQKRLQPTGSFYGTNKSYQKIFGINKRCLRRSKKRLQEAGLIRCITHQGRGLATYYFILDTTPKETKAEPKKPENRPPLVKEELEGLIKVHGPVWTYRHEQMRGYTKEEVDHALCA